MNNFIPIFILLFFANSLSAQDYFARIMDWKDLGLDDGPTDLLLTENEELIWSISRNTDTTFGEAGLMKTNLEGDIIWQIELDSTSYAKIIVTDENELIVGGIHTEIPYPEDNIRLYKINTSGEIIQQTYHLTPYPFERLVTISKTQEFLFDLKTIN